MNQKSRFLSITLLALIAGLVCLAACGPQIKSSPLLSPMRSPISPVASPTATVPPASLQLTVLHTNDTWGYLLPCG